MPTPKHIVAVAGLVSDAEGRVLLLRSPRRDWEFPGGQVEEGEDLVSALVREIAEETGIVANVGNLVGVYSNLHSGIVMFDLLCEAVGGNLRTSAESLAVEWVERNLAYDRITRPPIRDRMRQMLEFDGRVVYRAYRYDGANSPESYTIAREQTLSDRIMPWLLPNE